MRLLTPNLNLSEEIATMGNHSPIRPVRQWQPLAAAAKLAIGCTE
jgi:hypothetical protein